MKLLDNSLPVRFEELAEPEDVSASASVVSLAQATGCAPDAVCAAVGRAHADPLVVKSRAALTLPLSAHWNKETEAIFIDKGFAEVNQKLGYK